MKIRRSRVGRAHRGSAHLRTRASKLLGVLESKMTRRMRRRRAYNVQTRQRS